jgi:hypothetical protein
MKNLYINLFYAPQLGVIMQALKMMSNNLIKDNGDSELDEGLVSLDWEITKISLTGGFEPPTFRLTAERSTD